MGVLILGILTLLGVISSAIYFQRQLRTEQNARVQVQEDLLGARAETAAIRQDRDALQARLADVRRDLVEVRGRAADELHAVWTLLYEERARNAGEPVPNSAGVLAALDRVLSGAAPTPASTSISPVRGAVQPGVAPTTENAPAASTPTPSVSYGTSRG